MSNFQWQDPFHLDEQLTADERMIRDAAYEYCQGKLMPRVQDMFRHEKTDASIFREMGELGLLGPTIPTEYGGWPELCELRPGGARDRACGLGLPLHGIRTVFAGHGAHQRIRH